MTSPILVPGENTTSSNSFTIVPGPKLPNDPPRDFDGHVEYFPAREAKLVSPLPISSSTLFASSTDGTRMWRAVALIASGGSPYSSLPNAFWNESKMPIESGVAIRWRVALGEKASARDNAATATAARRKRRDLEIMVVWTVWNTQAE
eukprot:CAMPEP_0181086968 /NCGR_PEP_ID=MMETSP1071-20121207/6028_1 /TAXON_ID=35127 /ORGANISM="Thalassiosira sp., Strain NH16" /LENGTH=147 /DNA_ID=CAMNT_0023168837 /DNA_START=431 /DNA_END=874 /DNA_ORIENTATION=+